MKQIYDFEKKAPPLLHEAKLRAELEKRRLRRQTALLAAVGILVQIILLVFGCMAADTAPQMAAACIGYVLISATGSGVLALVYAKKGGSFT